MQSPSNTNRNFTRFLGIYLIIVSIDLLVCHLPSLTHYRIASKPLIISSLMLFFWLQNRRSDTHSKLMYMALFCSLMGDIILIYSESLANSFIFGLLFFLLAHVFYSIIFWRQIVPAKINRLQTFNYFLALICYATFFFYFMHNYFAELLVPVVVYMIAILTMAFLASCRKNSVSRSSFKFVLWGAIFFIVSDSILAINQFRTPLPYSDIWVMSTYAAAQLCIVWGIVFSQREAPPLQTDISSYR